MQLRKSVTLIIGICFTALITFLFVMTQTLTHHNLSELEDELISANMRRSINAVTAITANLDLLVDDWANWNDTYGYLEGKNDDYLASNLSLETVQSLKINLVMLVDRSQQVVSGLYLPTQKEHFVPLVPNIETTVQSLLADPVTNQKKQGFKGIVSLNDTLFLISSRPVLTSHHKGPTVGWLVMAKEMNSDIIEELKLRTELTIGLTHYNRLPLPETHLKRRGSDSSLEVFPLIEKTKKAIHCTGPLKDLRGDVIAFLTVSSSRDIYNSGMTASLRFLPIIIIGGIITGWLLLVLLDRKIVRRTALLKKQVDAIHDSDVSHFVPIPGQDEVANLSQSILRMLGILQQNFTELQLTQQSLLASEEKYKSLFMNTGNALAVVDEQTTILLANQEFYKMMNIPQGERVEGQSWVNFFSYEEIDRMKKWHYWRRQDPTLAPRSYETRYKDYNGNIRHSILTAAMIPGTQNSSLSLFDITDKIKAEQELKAKAFYDALTGLPNRQLFTDRLKHAIDNATRSNTLVGVILLDLDNFKNVNDTLGHQAGDKVLQNVASRIANCIRTSDTLARLGGDEFIIIIEGPTSIESLCRRATNIIADSTTPYTIESNEFHLGVSIGIAVYPEAGDNPETLLKNADLAMYESKQKGKNQYNLFTPRLNDLAHRRISLDKEIRYALNNDTFEVFYQPKVNLHDNKIYGMEALVRGRNDNGELIPPGEFIPFAEANGLIVPIDLLVLKKACQQAAQWKKEGLGNMTVSVNISTRHFHKDNFISKIKEILQESGLPPSCLELEVTETAMMKDFDQAISSLNSLRNLGISLSLDDFGTGYSSLNYLHNLPIQTLKIDKSFTDHLNNNHSSTLELVKIIILIAKAMDISIVAEGVETHAQQKILQSIGCNQAQGFLFAKPLSEEEFHKVLLSNQN